MTKQLITAEQVRAKMKESMENHLIDTLTVIEDDAIHTGATKVTFDYGFWRETNNPTKKYVMTELENLGYSCADLAGDGVVVSWN